MKKRPEKTKHQRERELRFIRRGPIKFRRYKKLISHQATKEDLVLMISAILSNLARITFLKKRKYKNIPAYGRFNKYPRKVLVGMYSRFLQLARKEGMLEV